MVGQFPPLPPNTNSETSSNVLKATKSLEKSYAKEFADRIADINQQVQTGDVNFVQASG